jgi:hypothetical protein
MKNENPGYHITVIDKGIYGEFSKVVEEFQELQDAWNQHCHIMALVEYSDLLGAMEAYYGNEDFTNYLITANLVADRESEIPYIDNDIVIAFAQLTDNPKDKNLIVGFLELTIHFLKTYNLSHNDLMIMSSITKRAFINGRRTVST